MTFAKLTKSFNKLESIPYDELARGPVSNKEYWDQRATFTQDLRDHLDSKEQLKKITKSQLVTLIGWCSTYRPYPSHSIFIILSQINDTE